MPTEIETKFKIKSRAAVRRNLKKIGAAFLSRGLEKDTYYHDPAGRSNFSAMRLRTTGNKGVFTVKSPVKDIEPRIFKIRDELEIKIDDAGAFADILYGLGFAPSYRKEKIREAYEWNDTRIYIDKLPYIGFYVEIEASKKESIKKAARLLGLDIQNGITDAYMNLFNYYRILHKKPKLECVFKRRPNQKRPKA